jgi:hypothetical protein
VDELLSDRHPAEPLRIHCYALDHLDLDAELELLEQFAELISVDEVDARRSL